MFAKGVLGARTLRSVSIIGIIVLGFVIMKAALDGNIHIDTRSGLGSIFSHTQDVFGSSPATFWNGWENIEYLFVLYVAPLSTRRRGNRGAHCTM